MKIKIKRLNERAIIPVYAKPGDSGFDICACMPDHYGNGVQLQYRDQWAVPTGLAFEIPEGYELQIRPRSGLASKNGITVLNAPGTVDSGYRGEVGVILINHSTAPFTITHGMKIAQGVICPVVRAELVESDELGDTERGDGGFGSTGV
jgi:dUTP pyrophosphatase